MNRAMMSKQTTEVPMACGPKKKGYKSGGMVKSGKGYKAGGMVKGKKGSVDQSMCSPRKQMAMGKG